MKFEQDTLTRVIEARSKVFTAREAQNVPALGQAEGGLRAALGNLCKRGRAVSESRRGARPTASCVRPHAR